MGFVVPKAMFKEAELIEGGVGVVVCWSKSIEVSLVYVRGHSIAPSTSWCVISSHARVTVRVPIRKTGVSSLFLVTFGDDVPGFPAVKTEVILPAKGPSCGLSYCAS